MQQAVQGMQHILDDTLDAERLGSGRYVLSKGPTDVRELVNAVVRSMASTARDLEVEVTVDMDDQIPPWVYLDGSRITQVRQCDRGHVAWHGNHDKPNPLGCR